MIQGQGYQLRPLHSLVRLNSSSANKISVTMWFLVNPHQPICMNLSHFLLKRSLVLSSNDILFKSHTWNQFSWTYVKFSNVGHRDLFLKPSDFLFKHTNRNHFYEVRSNFQKLVKFLSVCHNDLICHQMISCSISNHRVKISMNLKATFEK